MNKWLCLILIGLMVFPAKAQEAPLKLDDDEELARPELLLNLRECVYRALRDNLELASARLNPQIAQVAILSARGAFDPTFSGTSQYGLSNTPEASTDSLNTQSEGGNYDFSFVQPTALGTQFQLNTTANFNNYSSSDGIYAPGQYSTFAGLTVTQPLLKGFGTDINLAPIHIAEHGLAGSEGTLRFQAEQMISDVVDAYDDLIFARDNRTSVIESLDLAQKILVSNEERLKIGVMSPLDVAQAHAEVANRMEAVITARQAVHTQENTLKRLISRDFLSLVGQGILPTDLPPVDVTPGPVLGDMTAALKNRGDYQEAVEQLKQNELQTKVAKNGVLPQVNVVANYGYNGLSTNLNQGLNQLVEQQYPAYSAGLTVQFPLGDRTAIAQRRTAELQEEQAELAIQSLEQNILVQVDNAVESVETVRRRLVTARAATDYARQSLEAEQRKLDAGTSTTYMVLQLQRDYTQARTNELQDVADLRKAQTELLRTEGLILPKFGVVIDPMNDETRPLLLKKKGH
jgi:outer membrane protein TolC